MNGNLKNSGSSRFQNQLYQYFIADKKRRVDETAEKMGIHKDTLYRWIRGANPFPIDELDNLTEAIGEPYFIEHFTRMCGYRVTREIADKKAIIILEEIRNLISAVIE